MKTIMIVDDKTENLYLLESLLSDGNKIVTASNGAEALGLARKSNPDLIITDILMPVMDGFTLCQEWRKDDHLKHIPFVFYTATYTDAQDEKFALSLGADLFLLKPLEPEVFLPLIKGLLEKVEANQFNAQVPEEIPEVINLREYNQVLVRKLEDKIVDAERSRTEMLKYARELEKEIEERKTAESTVKQREEQYRTLVESMNEGMVLVDSDDTILFVNSQFCQMSGYAEAELIGKTGYLLLFRPEDRQIILDKNLSRSSGVKDSYEISMLRKDGSEVWVKISGSPVYNSSGTVVGSLGVFENIHEKKLIAEQLINEQQLFQTLAMASPVGIFRTLPNGNTTYINPKWSELSGLSFEEAMGDGWKKAVHPDDLEKLEVNWQLDIGGKKPSAAEYRFVRPDGTIIWVMGDAVPEWNQGEFAGYVGTITDVTERKKFEEEILMAKERAEDSNRLKTAFLNNISHEVRTPLNGILGFGELIVDPDLTTEEKNMYLDVLFSSSDRLLKTINDFMDISLITSGNLEVRPALFNLNELMNQLLHVYKSKALAKNLNISVKVPKGSNSFLMDSDAALMKKVLSNMLDNAVKFSTSGSVEFGYTIEPEQLLFYVRDEGIGIALDKQDQIFENFMQEDPLTTKKYGGSGLGLSIAGGIVKLLGGKIWVESEKGKGSIFYFTI
ncbi:MAG: PAS domain S-box protein [Bacteroidota bacterium]